MKEHAQEISIASVKTKRIASRNPICDKYYKKNKAMRQIAERWMIAREGWVVASFRTMRELYGDLFNVSGEDEQRCIWCIGGNTRFSFIPVAYLEDSL